MVNYRENEEQLDEHSTEGQDSSHQSSVSTHIYQAKLVTLINVRAISFSPAKQLIQ